MAITDGSDILASDFVSTSSGAADSGKVAKLDSAGLIPRAFVSKNLQFGGDGSDGALAISSGTTTVSLGGARFFIKNYTSISITGTAKLAFSNAHASGTTVLLRSQGDITLTSNQTPMVDASALGAAGNASPGSVSSSGSSTSNGGNGGTGSSFADFDTAGGSQGTNVAGADGSVPSAYSFHAYLSDNSITRALLMPFIRYGRTLWVGAGGGSGSAYNNSGSSHSLTGGAGGNGGGCLIMECGGAWNFTTANGISVAGVAGSNASGTGGTNFAAGGGGGGGAGFFLALYNTLTANTGTVTTTGGALGSNTSGTGNFGRGGCGANAVSAASGAGAAGLAVVIKNTEFV